jgi:catechol 2,3-dioxygenase-like lactoylglutathione lyase family enzyme
MRSLALVSLLVRDYDEAIRFFCEKRWVVVAPANGGAGLLLARAATPEQAALVGRQGAGRVFLFLHTDDIRRDFDLYLSRGVKFVRSPARADYGTVAVFEDLCGNLWDLIGPRLTPPQAGQ